MSEDYTGERSGGDRHQIDQSKSEIIDVYGGLIEPDKIDVVQFELSSESDVVVTDGRERVFGYEGGFGEFRSPSEEELEDFNQDRENDYWFRGHEGYIRNEYFVEDE